MVEAVAKKEQGIDYNIYTFEKSASATIPSAWQKQDTHSDIAPALMSAETLFATGKYAKVEVKQQYYDTKKQRKVDVTLKTYELQKKRGDMSGAVMLLFAVACGVAAFTATLYLVR